MNDVLKAFELKNGKLSANPVMKAKPLFQFRGGTPSISANGSSEGIVWTIGNGSAGQGVLHAYDANNLSNELYNSDKAGTRDQPGVAVKFSVPTIAGRKGVCRHSVGPGRPRQAALARPRNQKASAETTSPLARVARPRQAAGLIVSLTNWTCPSQNRTLTPAAWKLRARPSSRGCDERCNRAGQHWVSGSGYSSTVSLTTSARSSAAAIPYENDDDKSEQTRCGPTNAYRDVSAPTDG